ncbi:hypothetical protein FACS1894177_01010 [Bacteroidia bacterium]|nr:hypothetical protein FACS1894177_01010 [Bacteroidia bacterium]
MVTLPLSHLVAKFSLDGQMYEIERFKIGFSQDIDHKGQPEHETIGGKMFITITQAADNNLYLWAKKSTLLKSGQVLFQTDLGMTVLEIDFVNAYCINLTRDINAYTGTTTSLILSPEKVVMNGKSHENAWKK